jgi:hypothetical protein
LSNFEGTALSQELVRYATFNVTALSSRSMSFRFTSQQNVVTHRPGFVWNARMSLLPGIAIHVHDAYVAGVGTLHPAIMGLFSLTHQKGSGDIARGELMRYMMEATWYPTALLPSQGTTGWRSMTCLQMPRWSIATSA